MAHHPDITLTAQDDDLRLGSKTATLRGTLLIVGIVGIVAALLLSFLFGGVRHFFLAYLVAFLFALSFAVGGLFFTLLQHATKAGWSVTVRRVPEALGASFGPLLLLAVPILVSLALPGETVLEPTAAVLDDHAPTEGDFVGNKVRHDAGEFDGGVEFASMPTLFPWAAKFDESEFDDYSGAYGPEGADATQVGDQMEKNLTTFADGEHGEGEHAGEHVNHDELHHFDEPFTVLTSVATEEAVFEHFVMDDMTYGKLPYLNGLFFTARLLICMAALWIVGSYFYNKSRQQDGSADPMLSDTMRRRSYPALIVFTLAISVLSWDLIMSLDPHWYSTIVAVYYFAGAAVAIFALMAVLYPVLHNHGMMQRAVTVEHLHDVGKFMFAFVIFWGYIAFSQYMLIWYAVLPDEVTWFARRGVTTVPENLAIFGGDGEAYAGGWWTIVSAALLVGHLFIPFCGLLSRHVKRRANLLAFWGVWLLIFHWLDLYWLVMPEMPGGFWVKLPFVEIAATVGVMGVWGWYVLGKLAEGPLVPVADPRLPESLAFHNI
jgi:hypothetical protein